MAKYGAISVMHKISSLVMLARRWLVRLEIIYLFMTVLEMAPFQNEGYRSAVNWTSGSATPH
jgi:hypothetical protein